MKSPCTFVISTVVMSITLCVKPPSSAQAERLQTSDEISAALPSFYAPEARLREYVIDALADSPSLKASFAESRALEQRAIVAGALPDPMLSLSQSLRSVETRVGPQHQAMTLSQRFPWFGVRELRRNVARETATVNKRLAFARQRNTITQVKVTFYELAYLDRALRLTREERVVLDHYEALARAHYAAGRGNRSAALRIQAELTKLSDQEELLRRQRSSLAAKLNTLRNKDIDAPIPELELTDSLSVELGSLDWETLRDTAVANREELVAADAFISRAEDEVALARTTRRPDFTIGVSFVNVGSRSDPSGIANPPPDDGKNAVGVSFGMTLPIWRESYEAGIASARERLSEARHRQLATLNDVEFELREQLIHIDTIQNQIALYANTLRTQADEALRSSEIAYEGGELDAWNLLDGERLRFDVRLAEVKLSTDLLVRIAELERALGTAFPQTRPATGEQR